MDKNKDVCQNCGKLFNKKHLSCNIEYGIKKNVSVFRKHFKIDKNVIRDPLKFCKRCEKLWLPLNNLKGKKKIEEFLKQMKHTSEVTLHNDDETKGRKVESSMNPEDSLVVPGPSGIKNTVSFNDSEISVKSLNTYLAS